MYIHYLKTVQLCFIPCSNLRALSYAVFLIQYCNMIYTLLMIFFTSNRGKEKKNEVLISRDQSDSIDHIIFRIYVN